MVSAVEEFISGKKIDPLLKLDHETQGVFFVEQRTLPAQCLKSALLSAMVRNKHKLQPLSIYTTPINKSFKIFEYFGIRTGMQLSLRKDCKNIILVFMLLLTALLDVLRFILQRRDFSEFINNYMIKGIHVGDLIFDTYIRWDNTFIKPEKHIIKLYYHILKTQYITRKLLKAFETHSPKLVIVTTRAYASPGGIMARIALKRGIPTWIVGSTYHYKLYDYDRSFIGDYDYTIEMLNENLPQHWSITVDRYLDARFKGDLEQHDVKYAFSQKNNKNLSELHHWWMSNNKLPLVVIFAHAFSDANNFDGNIFFNSYYMWLKQTLYHMTKNSECLTILKPHPSARLYGEELSIYENLLKEINCNSSIYLLTEKVSTKDLLDVATTVVTCRGTVCLEATALGIPCIYAARPPYGDLKINHRAYNSEDYELLLKSSTSLSPPTASQIELSRKIIYRHHIIDYEQFPKQNNSLTPTKVFPKMPLEPNSSIKHIENYFDKYFDEMNQRLHKIDMVDDEEYKKLEEFSEKI